MDSLRLIIYKKQSIFDDIAISSQCIVQCTKNSVNDQIELKMCCNSDCSMSTSRKPQKISLNRKGFNAYLVSVYIHTLKRSNFYRKSAIRLLYQYLKAIAAESSLSNVAIMMKLHSPRKQFIDYAWNERTTRLALEKQEIDIAMAWLSTLGGAFSALGEQFEHCAKTAGKISTQQFKLALRLGDSLLVARCLLYYALSMMQLGDLRRPKLIIPKIYQFGVKEKDTRLQRMCQGVWAKLRFHYSQRRLKLNKNG